MQDIVDEVQIRIATWMDLESLNKHLPPLESSREHEKRLVDNESGKMTFLIAWIGDVPVGHAQIRWSGYGLPPLTEVYPGFPTLRSVRVWPPERWGLGIGRMLIAAAEDLVIERGYRGIGLGVEIDNIRAQKLYEHLGYEDWRGGELHQDATRLINGIEFTYDQVITAMTKRLN